MKIKTVVEMFTLISVMFPIENHLQLDAIYVCIKTAFFKTWFNTFCALV